MTSSRDLLRHNLAPQTSLYFPPQSSTHQSNERSEWLASTSTTNRIFYSITGQLHFEALSKSYCSTKEGDVVSVRVGVQNGRLEQRGAQETAKTPETPNSQVMTGMDNFNLPWKV